ncbi:MAG: hypothetical protein ABIY37_05245, partial [Devosia sp.]
LEAAIEAAHPEHVPQGPAEPPEMVQAYGEMPEEDVEERPATAFVVAGEMAAHEPIVETPVSYFVPEPESETESEPTIEAQPGVWVEEPAAVEPELTIESEPQFWAEEPVPEPEMAPGPLAPEPEPEIIPEVEEELDYIDIEPDPVVSEVETPRPPKAGGPASAAGVPYKPEVEPAAE